MAFPTTEIEASIDAVKRDAGWLIITTISVRAGRELHKRISDPIAEDEAAYWHVGGERTALERLGIPVGLTSSANELREWSDTDRFTLVYSRYHSKESSDHATLEQAFRAAESMSDYGEGFPEGIQEIRTKRTLYRHKIGGWDRVAADAPSVDEFLVDA